ncbi:hypothetical protein [Amycolatopsis minnesotensis]
MMLSLRIVALLLLSRLLIMDLDTARDWWGWTTVGLDVLIGLMVYADREPERPAEQDVRS